MYYLLILWSLCKRYWIWIGLFAVCLGTLSLLLAWLSWPR